MNIEIQLRLTPEIIKRCVRYFWISVYVRQREIVLTTIFLCLLVGIVIADGVKSWTNVIFGCLYGCFTLWFWLPRFRIYLRLLKEKMNFYRQLSGGVFKLQLTESTVILTAGQRSSEFQWGELKRIIESDDFLLLWWSGLEFTILPIGQLNRSIVATIRQKFAERTLSPNILLEVAQNKNRVARVVLRAGLLWILLMILLPVVLFLFIFLSQLKESRLALETYSGKFWVEILRVESRQNYFAERLQIHGFGDMKVSLGIGSPRKAGQSVQVYGDGTNSTCEVIIKVNTSTNTLWHSEIAGSVLDTKFSNTLVVSDVDTNLSGLYGKGSIVTLAKLDGEGIELSIR